MIIFDNPKLPMPQCEQRSQMIILLSNNNQIVKQYLQPGATVGFIPTASELDDDRWYMEKDRTALENMGFNVLHVEISTESKTRIANKLSGVDAVFVAGGNTYYLLQKLKEKDVLPILADLARRKTYIGASAGSCLACPSIDYLDKLDDKTQASPLAQFDALNLVDFYVLPHYSSKDKYTGQADQIEAKYPDRKFIKLPDNKAIIVDDKGNFEIAATA